MSRTGRQWFGRKVEMMDDNFSAEVPSRLLNYPFKNPPYTHQKAYLQRFWRSKGAALFAEMGTGKSFMLIYNAAMLYDDGEIDSMLVIAPKGVYMNWGAIEIPKHLPDHIPREVAVWGATMRKAEQEQYDKMLRAVDGLRILVMNIEAFRSSRAVREAQIFVNSTKCMVVVDESTTIKNRRTEQAKQVTKIGKQAAYKRIATGSPVTRSPMDLWSQCNFLGDYLDYDDYWSFQARYAVTVERKMPTHTFKEIVGYRHLEELKHKLSTFTFRVTKEECLDLPEKIYLMRTVPMSAEQEQLYNQMRKAALAVLDSEIVSTKNALTQLLRLHQIVCGHIRLDNGELRTLRNTRLNELENALQETQGKVIIWATYRPDIEAIRLLLQDRYGMDSVATYFGDTPPQERQEIVNRFQDPSSALRFFLANPSTGGYGLTLTQAKTVIYYSNSFDLEERLQSEDRAHRIGQTNRVTYIDLVCQGTVDEHIVKALRNKINIASQVLGEGLKKWLI